MTLKEKYNAIVDAATQAGATNLQVVEQQAFFTSMATCQVVK